MIFGVIGSVFASPTRFRSPIAADFAKNVIFENFDCQFFIKFREKLVMNDANFSMLILPALDEQTDEQTANWLVLFKT